MNCVLIETAFGPYCDSHRTWHTPEPANWSYRLAPNPLPRPQHTCRQEPDGHSDECLACLAELTGDA